MGAWAIVYRRGISAPLGSDLAFGIVALKKELISLGYAQGIVLTPVFGDAMHKRTVEFQAASGLVADGVIGPKTAKRLFQARAQQEETRQKIPGEYLQRLKTLESANDPAARGTVDRADCGLVQINTRIHTNVTVQQAFDPAFSLRWAANTLAGALLSLGDWDASVASYNVGMYGARQWLQAGKPSTGGPLLGGTPLYERAYRYVQLVKSQTLR